ncbi:MAG: DJ-1/PfpI family protein [Gammaproteobacteria bacterium]
MNIAILLYEGITALDAIGPYEVLHRMPDTSVQFVARERGLKRTDSADLALNADYTLDEITAPEIILIPGTPNPEPLLKDETVLAWIRDTHTTTKWTTSVCTGALALGAAGLLKGIRATTHWLALDGLQNFGAIPARERVVREGKIITAAGVSSGIDMALTLAALEYGEQTAQEMQLIIEYDPEPPFNAGSPDKAPKEITEKLRTLYGDLSH